MNEDSEVSKESVKDVPFTTVANLVTALFMEVKRTYITGKTQQDKKIRKRIEKTIEIVNEHQEIANLIIKGNPFHRHHTHSHKETGGNMALPDTVKEASAHREDQSNSSDFSESSSDSGDDSDDNYS